MSTAAHPLVELSAPLARVVRRIDSISTLPQIALRVMDVANDPRSSALQLKEILESDAALSARVLRCVNSSAYAMRTRITNLQHAVSFLGLKQIRNLAMLASVAELFQRDETIGTYRRLALWKHLVCVGLAARMIALRRRFSNSEDMFLAGLLHDVGLILADQYAHEGFCRVMNALRADATLCTVERELLGFDHAELGAAVAENWRFPEPMVAAMAYHHKTPAYRGPSGDVVYCVEVANFICSVKGYTSIGVNLARCSPAAVQGLALTKDDILVLSEDLDREVEQNSTLFEIMGKHE